MRIRYSDSPIRRCAISRRMETGCRMRAPLFRTFMVSIVWYQYALFICSVADPDPQDPYVFGPPGSGSNSTRYGSGSRRMGMGCRMRVPLFRTFLVSIVWFALFQCCGSVMFIQDPGSEFFPSRILPKNLSTLTQKIVVSKLLGNMIRVVHP